MLPRVSNLAVVTFPSFRDGRGRLSVAELAPIVQFPVRRLFWIDQVPEDASRGGHAHKLCNQFMICLSGRISVDVYDGLMERTLSLPANSGIHIPPAIYATERFEEPSSLLAVLCDLSYDKSDYIHDRAELAAFRSATALSSPELRKNSP